MALPSGALSRAQVAATLRPEMAVGYGRSASWRRGSGRTSAGAPTVAAAVEAADAASVADTADLAAAAAARRDATARAHARTSTSAVSPVV